MPKKTRLPQSPHHIMTYDEDWEWMESRFGAGSGVRPLGISTVLREKIHQWVTEWRERENQALQARSEA